MRPERSTANLLIRSQSLPGARGERKHCGAPAVSCHARSDLAAHRVRGRPSCIVAEVRVLLRGGRIGMSEECASEIETVAGSDCEGCNSVTEIMEATIIESGGVTSC